MAVVGFQEYPKRITNAQGKRVTVDSEEEELKALGKNPAPKVEEASDAEVTAPENTGAPPTNAAPKKGGAKKPGKKGGAKKKAPAKPSPDDE